MLSREFITVSSDVTSVLNAVSDFARIIAPPPSLTTFENAAQAAYDPSTAASLGLTEMLDKNGNPLTETLSSGMTATAFRDKAGNVLVAYSGTSTNVQYQLDLNLLSGTNASSLQGFKDAVSFANQVEAAASSENIASSSIYVVGHSLGGTLAEYVASQTGLPGVSFAGSGVPGYQAPATPAANFVSYVENGDPFANYATDTTEKGSAAVANPSFAHYGSVVHLGTTAGTAALSGFASEINGYSLAQVEVGAVPGGFAEAAVLAQQEQTLMNDYHQLSNYDADAASTTVPASAFGVQKTTLSAFIVSAIGSLPALEKQMPKILAAGSTSAMLSAFAADFPTLAREATAMMHAPNFAAAAAELSSVDPALYRMMTTQSGASALMTTLTQDPRGLLLATIR